MWRTFENFPLILELEVYFEKSEKILQYSDKQIPHVTKYSTSLQNILETSRTFLNIPNYVRNVKSIPEFTDSFRNTIE